MLHLPQRSSGRPSESEVVEQIAQDSSTIAFRRFNGVQARLAGSQSAKSDRDRHSAAQVAACPRSSASPRLP